MAILNVLRDTSYEELNFEKAEYALTLQNNSESSHAHVHSVRPVSPPTIAVTLYGVWTRIRLAYATQSYFWAVVAAP
jgi:hypothetical protein